MKEIKELFHINLLAAKRELSFYQEGANLLVMVDNHFFNSRSLYLHKNSVFPSANSEKLPTWQNWGKLQIKLEFSIQN